MHPPYDFIDEDRTLTATYAIPSEELVATGSTTVVEDIKDDVDEALERIEATYNVVLFYELRDDTFDFNLKVAGFVPRHADARRIREELGHEISKLAHENLY